ncbi:MAG: CHRD domain-containing protein [Ferruginibacter sp.]
MVQEQFSGTYNPNNNQFIYTTTWAGLSTAPLTGGIYAGATGANGTIVGESWTILSGATVSGSLTDTLTLTSDQANQLTAGNFYYTYITTTNPTGEIRGQIIATR